MVRQQSTGTTPIKVQGNDGGGGGAVSEVWNRVYMIAPVMKFGRVKLVTNFPSKPIWQRKQSWKDDEFLLGFKFSRVQTSRKGFMNFFNGFVKHQKAWCMRWLHFSWFGISGSSVKLIEIFCLIIGRTWIFEPPACSIFYRFSIYNGIKTLFLILNICYEHTMIVWFLQKSYVNVH